VRAFLLLRYALIIATAYMLLAGRDFPLAPRSAALLIALALASNVGIAQLPVSVANSTRFATLVILCDTAWITAALVQTGRFSAEFFYLYFFVLLLAAIGESLGLIAIGACVVCIAYFFGHVAVGEGSPSWTSPELIRIPFLFSTAIFYGYMVDRTRREGRRADDAEALAAQLSRTLSEFKILYARAQKAERIKTELLATVSHELRTPLTSLLGYVELLMDQSYGPVNAGQRSALGRVQLSGRMLQQAISRMLDASRIEVGAEEVNCEEFELETLFGALRAELPGNESVAVDWMSSQDVPPLRTDGEKLRTVLRNLVENALKYTPRGRVVIDARWDPRPDEIEIRVADTGIGIAAGEIDGVFEAFRQASNPGQRSASGVGLGLYIVQRLVERLGGGVGVESELGRGSAFSIRIPRLLHRGAAVAAGPVLSV
jgi:signal transduction histidine kinase